jgi:beta-galactosidase
MKFRKTGLWVRVLPGVLACANLLWAGIGSDPVSLAGEWRFALDRLDKGRQERWFAGSLPERIRLPGVLQAQGYGDEISLTTEWMGRLHDPLWYLRSEYRKYSPPGNVRTPFLLQPDRHYTGAAWYQRDIEIPALWKGRRVVLAFERPHWQTEAWVDGKSIGTCDALGTSHLYDAGVLEPGAHVLTVRADNRMVVDVGHNAHSMTDYTQGNWNGIVGKIEMRSTGPVWLEDVQVFPNAAKKSAVVKVEIGNATGRKGRGMLKIGDQTIPASWDEKNGSVETELRLGDGAKTWDEFHPNLTHVSVRLEGEGINEERAVVFGMREIGVEGTRFTLNGKKIFLRGTHEGCSFPLTGHPPMDRESWKRIFRIGREYGLNHMRFHSWCPPEAAFEAADELGFFLQPECSIWARDGVRIDPGNETEAWLYEESRRMMKAYGNHPSFILLSHGNEPEGRWVESLSKWVEYWKERDSRRLYAACTGAAMKPELGPVKGTQFLVIGRIGSNPVRGQAGWNGKDYRGTVQGTDVPIITHELGQHAAFPDFREMKKYTGPFKPKNFEFFRESLKEHGMLNLARDFLEATGRLQVLGYKEDVEACLRTPGLAGFQLLDLHDYPGQGTSPIGILDSFWDNKGNVTSNEFRSFCDTTVILSRFSGKTPTRKEKLTVTVEAAHAGQGDLQDAVVLWKITDQKNTVAACGELQPQTIPFGTGMPLGTIEISLAGFAAPRQYRLVAGLKNTRIENCWNFWVYPDSVNTAPGPGILVATEFDRKVMDRLESGGKVLLMPPADQLSWDSPPFIFAPIFWNRQLFPKWDRSMGLLCDPKHPALERFPTDFHSDWQWETLIRPGCRAINLDGLPTRLKPIVQAIDDYNRNNKQGLVFECGAGRGKLLVCAFDLVSDAEKIPAKRQLMSSLLSYMGGRKFNPSVSATPGQIASLFFDNKTMSKLGAKATADAESPGNSAANLIDGSPATAWLTPSRGEVKGFPHQVTLTLDRPVIMSGILFMNQQRDRKRIGEIKEYVIEAGADGQGWVEIRRGSLESKFSTQRIFFSKPIRTDSVRFTALSSFDGGSVAAMAEMAVIVDEGKSVRYEKMPEERKKEKQLHPDEIDGGTGEPSLP